MDVNTEVNELLRDVTVMTLQERLFKLPAMIAAKQLTALNNADLLERNTLLITALESEAYLSVESELSIDGKKLYSNEEKRRIETRKRLNENKAFAETENVKKSLERNKARLEIETALLSRMFRAAEALTSLDGEGMNREQ